MRVYVEHDMTVNHDTNVVTLKAGQIVEGPLAVYLVESGCDVTIEQDDRPAPAVETASSGTGDGAGAPDGEQSHTPGSAEHDGAEPNEGVEQPAEPGAAE